MSKSKDYTAGDLARQAQAAASLIEYLRNVDEDDDDLLQDMVEGETSFLELIDRVLYQEAEAEMMVAGLQVRIAQMTERKNRYAKRKDYLRGILMMAMTEANGDGDLSEKPFTLTTAVATVTLRQGKAKVIVTDEAALPANFWRTPDPVIDKQKLNEYCAPIINPEDDVLEDVERDLPKGVEIAPPGTALAIRRK